MSKRWKRLLIVSMSLLATVLVAGVFLLRWVNSSSQGTVTVGQPPSAPVAPAPPLSLTTPYFSTELPAAFTTKRNLTDPSPTVKLQLVAATASDVDEQVAITIAALSSGGLASVGDYNLRLTQTATYSPYTAANVPAGAKAFKTVDGTPDITLFWPYGQNYAEIAISTGGGATPGALQSVMASLLSQWKWQ